jgi:hypothetical protein
MIYLFIYCTECDGHIEIYNNVILGAKYSTVSELYDTDW